MLTDLLHQRRSLRKYLPKLPPLNWLSDIIRCGQTAPSPSNSQSVRVRLVASDKSRDELKNAMARQRELLLQANTEADGSKRTRNYIRVYYRYSEFMFNAPWLLLVGTAPAKPGFADHMAMAGLRSDKGRGSVDHDIAVGLFVSAMLLRATELGLASCILSAPLVFLAPEVKLPIFNQINPKCFITLGFGAETPPAPNRLALDDIFEEF